MLKEIHVFHRFSGFAVDFGTQIVGSCVPRPITSMSTADRRIGQKHWLQFASNLGDNNLMGKPPFSSVLRKRTSLRGHDPYTGMGLLISSTSIFKSTYKC